MRRIRLGCAAALLLLALQAQAQWVDPGLRWRTLDTAHFSLHFPEPRRAQAEVAAGVAEAVYPRVTGWLHWEPQARTHLVLLDSADFANGYASPLPFAYAAIFLSPPDEGELLQNLAWLELVLTHEFTHVVHLDKARRAPLALRHVFGRLAWLFPNALEPGWITEGLAVYSESEAAKAYGRLGQSHFEGMMRAEAARGLRSLREVNAEGRGFPLNRDYLYGGYFFAFLAERYGPNAVTDYVEHYSENLLPFRVESNPALVTGKPMSVLWLEYEDWLRARFAPASADAAQGSVGEIVARAWSLTSPALGSDGALWYVEHDGYTRPRLMRRPAGAGAAAVREVEAGTRISTNARGDALLAQPEICDNYNYFYDLYLSSPDGRRERLTRCSRFRFAAPLDDGRIVALRIVGGEAEVAVLGADGALQGTLYRAAPGEMLTGLAAKGERVVVTRWRDGRWALSEIAGGKELVLVEDDAVKHSPRFGESADEIYFVADYGRVYNVWSWRPDQRRLARWTQAPFGVREISAPAGGEIFLTTIEADGDILRRLRLAQAPLETRAPAVAPAAAPAAAQAAGLGPDRPYAPWSSLLPRSWFPLAEIADGEVALGVQTFGQDALGLHQYALAPLFEFTQHEQLGSAAYVYDGRHGVLLDRRMTVKASSAKDGSGNSLSDRKIDAYTIDEDAQWVSTWRHVSLGTSLYWGLGAALDRARFHEVGVGASSPHDERVGALVAGIDTRRRQWLSEGPSQGQQLRLFAETSNGLGGDFSGNVYRGDWRAFLPIRSTVLSLRWNEVYAQPEARPIELGGSFSEETYGYALPVLNQRQFPLRGYRSGEAGLTGHRARLGTLEWRMPLADVDRHFLVPPAGLNRVSLNLFVDSGAAWDSAAERRYHRGYGAELMSELRLGYLLEVQVRLGVAKGIDEFGRTMGYLRVGRSF